MVDKLVEDLKQGGKPKPDYGFKGYWDDAIFGLLFRLVTGVIAATLLHLFAPAHAVKIGLWGAAIGWAIWLRVANCNLSFPAWGWVFVIAFAATFGVDVWSFSKP